MEGSLKLNYQNSICHIIDEDLCESDVLPETVGQYTGLVDSLLNKAFEGDVIQLESKKGVTFTYVIKWDKKRARFALYDVKAKENSRQYGRPAESCIGFEQIKDLDRGLWEGTRIIGNIYDNPELLKPEE